MVNINIGIDIGGNHTGIGIVDDDGSILEKEIMDYKNDEIDGKRIFQKINSFLSEHKKYNIQSIGIGLPGIATNTHIDYTCHLPLGNIEIRDYIKTKLPIYVTNDANAATIAEYQVADGKFYSNYALVTIGTGIGSGLILNSELYSGTSGAAGEIGHMVIEKDGLECECGRRGCFEQYASVTALKRLAGLDSTKEIFYLAERNEVIQRVLDNYLENLSEGLANFINLYDIEMLVIGGSLSEYGYKYITKLKSKMLGKIYNKYTYDLNIKTATLGNDAGIIGAAFLHEYLGKNN